MWSEEKIELYLRENLKEERLAHSLGVRDTSVKLAEFYGIDTNKARIAGLVHDCAKNVSNEQLITYAKEYKLSIDDVELKAPQLLHGKVAAKIAKHVMGIEEEDILNAISYHTTGRKHMISLEKIVYLADYIEPMRKFPGVDELRTLAFEDLDKALLKAFDITIKFIIDKGLLIHQNTIEARNNIIVNL